jgi:mycothiol system anti-sigma-R factor
VKQRDCFVSEEELYLYLDRELDPERALNLDNHLKECGDCAARYGAVSKLKSVLRDSRDSVKAPSWLRDRIHREILAGAPTGGGFWEHMLNLLRNRPLLPVGAAGLLVVVFLLVIFSKPSHRRTMPFVTEMVHEHYEYLGEPENAGILSSDPQEVSQWLAGNSDLQVALPSDPLLPPPVGACVLEHDGMTIGYVFFDREDKRISLFVTRDQGEALFAPTVMQRKDISIYCGNCTGMNYALWHANDLVCVLVGDIPEKELFDMAGRFI